MSFFLFWYDLILVLLKNNGLGRASTVHTTLFMPQPGHLPLYLGALGPDSCANIGWVACGGSGTLSAGPSGHQ
jgi:hypothetical protein